MSDFFRYRITYRKSGNAKYIGHLDLQNIFQRSIRRAGIKPRYSEGFNPHAVLSFASPLAVGMEGLKELSDIDLIDSLSVIELIERLNKSFPEGLLAVDCVQLSKTEKSAAALVRKARYGIAMCSDMEFAVNEFKSAENEINQYVYELCAKGKLVTATIACGGSGNLKPQLLAESLCSTADITFEPHKIEYTRQELFF
jgi:radical SAM-linked protein